MRSKELMTTGVASVRPDDVKRRDERGVPAVIQIKRTYEPPARGDGLRILVERLWPRGMRKAALMANSWMKDVAPSTALRMWFGHRVERWKEKPATWEPILEAARRRRVTLLYSAHDTLHNGALVLRDYLTRRATGARTAQKASRRSVARRGRAATRRPVR